MVIQLVTEWPNFPHTKRLATQREPEWSALWIWDASGLEPGMVMPTSKQNQSRLEDEERVREGKGP